MKSTRQRRHTVAKNAVLKFPYDESVVPVQRNILNRLILLWIILLFFPIGLRLNETSSPLNIATSKGAKVRLNCSTTKKKELIWRLRKPPTNKEDYIYINQVFYGDAGKIYTIDNSAGENADLSFIASENTSGEYRCYYDNVEDHIDIAQVIVLDAQPTCSSVEEAGFVKADCSIGFTGYWSPKLEWHDASGALKQAETTPSPYKHVNSSVSVPFNKADSYMLTCTPKFSLENLPTDTTAKNIPEYPNSCTVQQKVIAPTSTSTGTGTGSSTRTAGDEKARDPDSTTQSEPSASSPCAPSAFIIGMICILAYVSCHFGLQRDASQMVVAMTERERERESTAQLQHSTI